MISNFSFLDDKLGVEIHFCPLVAKSRSADSNANYCCDVGVAGGGGGGENSLLSPLSLKKDNQLVT